MDVSKAIRGFKRFLDNPILLLGWNLSIFPNLLLFLRSQKEVIAKLIAFCISEKLSRARSGPPKAIHVILL
jgi:hypothetical protein